MFMEIAKPLGFRTSSLNSRIQDALQKYYQHTTVGI